MKKFVVLFMIVLGGSLYSTIPLTESEAEGIKLIIEENKLARDLYIEFYEMWEYDTFNKVSISDALYMDKTKVALERFKINDPVENDDKGVYESLYITKLYRDLLKKGKSDPFEAMRIGTTLEEMHIKDLNDLLENTSNDDLIELYTELKLGAISHIRAFYNLLKKNGLSYEAQFLSNEELRAILLN